MYYQVGGCLSSNHHTYIEREADRQLYESLRTTEYCYVLNSRQIGKSSLKVRTMKQLQAEGFICVDIDLSIMGGKGVTPEEWYGGVVGMLSGELQPSVNIRDWWTTHSHIAPVTRFNQFINEILKIQKDRDIIIFFDEIDDVLCLNFKDSFFALIRSCYNQRATNPDYQHLTFCLLGVSTPAELIQDYSKTPFNIGQAIELKGFSLNDDLTPLEKGLSDKTDVPQIVLKEILFWTRGQPFLTQKICRLIKNSPDVIPPGKEAQIVRNLVQENLIINWHYHDEPQHFRTIEARLFRNEKGTICLLELYKQILKSDTLSADNSYEQVELKLSRLVIQDKANLKIFNPIYRQIFTLKWAEQKLDDLRPYARQLKAWEESFREDESQLLKGRELEDILSWKKDKSLGQLDHKFIAASQELERKKTTKNLDQQTKRANKWKVRTAVIALGFVVLGLASIGGGLYFTTTFCSWGNLRIADKCIPVNDLIGTSGEKNLFSNERNSLLDTGMAAFKKGDYKNAELWFKKAKDTAKNDPIPRIYLNNTIARAEENPYKIAVVVPIRYRSAVAQEVLRGVADAQTKFNNNEKQDNRSSLLEVVIYDDQSEPDIAGAIADKIAQDQSISAVVGHIGSDLSAKALPKYEKAKIVMISPTSTSPQLKGDYFYRPLPSDTQNGENLAKYVKENLAVPHVLIFYDSKSIFSKGLKASFTSSFEQQGGKIVDAIDMNADDFDPENIFDKADLKKEKIQAAILLPAINTLSSAIAVAIKSSKLPKDQRLKLFGNDVMYSSDLLCQAGQAVEGLVLPIPWQLNNKTKGYGNEDKEDKWPGSINWRTAMAYDATTAIIHSLSEKATRQSVSEKLKALKLEANETSGDPLFFRKNGDPERETRFVQVTKDAPNRPTCSQFGFKLISE